MNQEKGFSLIEVTIAVAIIGLAFYSLISVFKVIAPEDVNARTISVGAHIASRLSEETMSRGFNNIASVAATSVGAPFASLQIPDHRELRGSRQSEQYYRVGHFAEENKDTGMAA